MDKHTLGAMGESSMKKANGNHGSYGHYGGYGTQGAYGQPGIQVHLDMDAFEEAQSKIISAKINSATENMITKLAEVIENARGATDNQVDINLQDFERRQVETVREIEANMGRMLPAAIEDIRSMAGSQWEANSKASEMRQADLFSKFESQMSHMMNNAIKEAKDMAYRQVTSSTQAFIEHQTKFQASTKTLMGMVNSKAGENHAELQAATKVLNMIEKRTEKHYSELQAMTKTLKTIDKKGADHQTGLQNGNKNLADMIDRTAGAHQTELQAASQILTTIDKRTNSFHDELQKAAESMSTIDKRALEHHAELQAATKALSKFDQSISSYQAGLQTLIKTFNTIEKKVCDYHAELQAAHISLGNKIDNTASKHHTELQSMKKVLEAVNKKADGHQTELHTWTETLNAMDRKACQHHASLHDAMKALTTKFESKAREHQAGLHASNEALRTIDQRTSEHQAELQALIASVGAIERKVDDLTTKSMLSQDWKAAFDSVKLEMEKSRDESHDTIESKLQGIVDILGSKIDGHRDTALLRRLDTLIGHTHATEDACTKQLESYKYNNTMIQRKLDSMVEHTHITDRRYEQQMHSSKSSDATILQKLDKLVEQVRSSDKKHMQQFEHKETTMEKLEGYVEHSHFMEKTYFQQLAGSRYDDTAIQKKLDRLMEQIRIANNASEKLDMIEKIHDNVSQTSECISNMLEVRTHRVEIEREGYAQNLREALKNLQITRDELAIAQAENTRIEGIINTLCSIGGMGKTAINSAGEAAASAAESLAMQQLQITGSHSWSSNNAMTSSNLLRYSSLTNGTTSSHATKNLDLQELFVKDVKEIDTVGNLYGENNTVLGKVELGADGSDIECIKKEEPEVAEVLEALDQVKVPSISTLEGHTVDKSGDIVDAEGRHLGRIKWGDLNKLAGKAINAEGKVVNGFGKVLGEAEVTSKIERESLKEKFFSKLAGYTVDEEGRIVTSRGNIIGRLVENDSKMLYSRGLNGGFNRIGTPSNTLGNADRARTDLASKAGASTHRRRVSIDKEGVVLDGTGEAIGKLTSGDVERCVGKVVNVDGDIVDDSGSVWGHFSLAPQSKSNSKSKEDKQLDQNRQICGHLYYTNDLCGRTVTPVT